jgi:hypothetical protein
MTTRPSYLKFASAILLTGLAPYLNAGDLTKSPHICVQVLNNAAAQPPIVAEAIQECSQIFKSAGIAIDWLSIPSNEAHFLLTIETTASPAASETAVGYLSNDSSGSFAVIVWPRVTALVSYRTLAFEILGRVMAHELGHLLIGHPHHSDYGVMRPLWSIEDLRADRGGSFIFTKTDLEQMRNNMCQFQPQP